MGRDGRTGSGAGGRGDAAKADCSCRKCVRGPTNEPFNNFGSRSSCHSCGGTKGSCYLRDAPSSRSPTTSFAERQASQAKRGNEDELKALRAKCAKMVAENTVAKKLAARLAQSQPEANEVEDIAKPTRSLASLLKTKAFFESQGAGYEDNLAAAVAEIAEVREAEAATKPGHVQLTIASRRVDKATAACAKHAAKTLEVQKQLEAAQKLVADHKLLVAKEEQELQEAVAIYESTAKGVLSPEPPIVQPTVAAIAAMLAGLPSNILEADEESSALVQRLLGSLDKKKCADAAAAAAAREAAAAKRETDEAQLATELEAARVEKARVLAANPAGVDAAASHDTPLPPDDDSYVNELDDLMADVMLAAADVDVSIKRDMEAKFGEVVKRRRLRQVGTAPVQ